MLYRDNRAYTRRRRYGTLWRHTDPRPDGHLPAAFHIAPKLMWLRRHRPEVWARHPLFLQPRDLAALALTGVAATDGTHATATLLYDLRARRWSGEMLAALDMDATAVPPLRDSDAVVGELRPALVQAVRTARRGTR